MSTTALTSDGLDPRAGGRKAMNLGLVARVVRERRALRSHERWSRTTIDQHQATALDGLRRFAIERSSFYRRFHAGMASRPLNELPVLTKAELMASFDEVVTVPDVRLADVRAFLDALDGYRLFRDRYWVARTSGSTGMPGIFLWNKAEWTTVIASYARAQEWAGIRAGLLGRTRLAVVSSRVPWHQSALVGMSVDSPIVPLRRFDATSPIAEIVGGLNVWQPENLICYASMGRVLAEEQTAGRLRIAPRAVMCSSEVLTPESRRRIRAAFGVEPFNVYAATEPAGVAAECERRRLHLFEDLVITEVVDDRNRPVPLGTVGAKVLVTVLFARTQPLIRYEMSDTISLSSSSCDCGRGFAVVETIEGRIEDTLTLPATAGGTVTIHPNLFHRVLDAAAIRQWQVQRTREGLLVRIVPDESGADTARIGPGLSRALTMAGAAPVDVEVQRLNEIPRTNLGKAPLIRK
jgi:putative adenylate-forming enzyme